ncbi:hypothetical protein EVAR_80540_1 [Eumeta japonica]|uniref:Uncharacterized protein n=1 Tax=Eumeta variegata TaxID=151549 RepID=A0A4C1TND9_EUMVA|nr:hypothetical protein EVAR_80540_1 [Eumeta japonica]
MRPSAQREGSYVREVKPLAIRVAGRRRLRDQISLIGPAPDGYFIPRSYLLFLPPPGLAFEPRFEAELLASQQLSHVTYILVGRIKLQIHLGGSVCACPIRSLNTLSGRSDLAIAPVSVDEDGVGYEKMIFKKRPYSLVKDRQPTSGHQRFPWGGGRPWEAVITYSMAATTLVGLLQNLSQSIGHLHNKRSPLQIGVQGDAQKYSFTNKIKHSTTKPHLTVNGKGRNALKAALDSGREITEEQALDILGKLISDLRSFVAPKVNVHKPIKNQLETIEGVFEKHQKLKAQEQAKHQKTQSRTPKERRSPPLSEDPATDTNTEIEIETDVDTESASQDSRKIRKAKRKIRSTEDKVLQTIKKAEELRTWSFE